MCNMTLHLCWSHTNICSHLNTKSVPSVREGYRSSDERGMYILFLVQRSATPVVKFADMDYLKTYVYIVSTYVSPYTRAQ
jgi:hypothetical protein